MWKSKTHKTDEQNKVNEYWKEAKRFVKMRSDDPSDPNWFAFEWNDDARWKWELYFAWRLGFVPTGLKYLKSGFIQSFLVPCEKPEDFDEIYKPRIASGAAP